MLPPTPIASSSVCLPAHDAHGRQPHQLLPLVGGVGTRPLVGFNPIHKPPPRPSPLLLYRPSNEPTVTATAWNRSANTYVTLGVGADEIHHAPLTDRSCAVAHHSHTWIAGRPVARLTPDYEGWDTFCHTPRQWKPGNWCHITIKS
ncbi:hypothetical protein LX32DRAFT_349081 [Colletotrichum zoysiae]|uniref:Uncharacterized protein n=1 Tax=Colletotrichum zoysiae TaxID=1216348 RepID=A0AAD9M5Y1_9PEZI|nr:hypothetical protein LX32DRAFT_349081 [Colletotrichum zoysiae]